MVATAQRKAKTALIFFLLLVAAFLRLYKIRSTLLFLGDQGRDVLVVKRMLVDHKFTLLGPTASVGGFYLGPIYYYFMLFPLWLSRLDPVGPAIMVALLGVLGVWLIYRLASYLVGQTLAFLPAILWAFSAPVVKSQRFSWNPNVLPLFSLLFFYFVYRWHRSHRSHFLLYAGGCLGIAIQLHYLALILLPLSLFLIFRPPLSRWFKDALPLAFGGLITFSPFILFELRHSFPNTRTIIDFLTRPNSAVTLKGFKPYERFWLLSRRLFQYALGFEGIDWVVDLIITSLLFLALYYLLRRRSTYSFRLFISWILGVLILGLYQGQIYDYYFNFLLPLPFILLTIFFRFFWKKQKLATAVVLFSFLTFFLKINWPAQAIFDPPIRLVDQTQRIARLIEEKSQGKPFNFALITAHNSDHAYRYFLEIDGFRPKTLEEEVTEQLFVVCEEPACQPLGHPLWEIAGFGRAIIDGEWRDPVGIKIYRLIHHPDSQHLIGKPAPKGV